MAAIILERFLGALVNSVRVEQEVRVGTNLSDHWSVCHDLFLQAVDLVRQTKVNDLVDVLRLTALVLLKRLRSALFSSLGTLVALFSDEAFSLAPGQNSVHGASLTPGARLITLEHFFR